MYLGNKSKHGSCDAAKESNLLSRTFTTLILCLQKLTGE